MIFGQLIDHHGVTPTVDPTAFVANGAVVIGDVEIGADASIWHNSVLRGDVSHIRIGARSNIQDGTVIHVTTNKFPTIVGADVLVGHIALLHGCVLEDGCMVGMRAMVMDGAVVESGAMVAAGALVAPGKRVPSGQLWAGTPAKHLRDLGPQEREYMRTGPAHYVDLAKTYY